MRIATSLLLVGLPKLTVVCGECRFEAGICVGSVLDIETGGTDTGCAKREVSPVAPAMEIGVPRLATRPCTGGRVARGEGGTGLLTPAADIVEVWGWLGPLREKALQSQEGVKRDGRIEGVSDPSAVLTVVPAVFGAVAFVPIEAADASVDVALPVAVPVDTFERADRAERIERIEV